MVSVACESRVPAIQVATAAAMKTPSNADDESEPIGPIVVPASDGGRAPLRVARKAVFGQRIPRRGVGRELVVARTDAGVGVEDAEANRRHPTIRAPAPHARAAGRAEDLREAVRRLPRAQKLLALQDPDSGRRHGSLDRRAPAGAPLTAGAVAPARALRVLGQLEAHTAAVTAAGEH